MEWPGGRWLIGAAAVLIIGAGVHYMRQGWTNEYRQHLRANPVTTRWNPVLKAGLIAHGVVVGVVGLLFGFAAWQANPSRPAAPERRSPGCRGRSMARSW